MSHTESRITDVNYDYGVVIRCKDEATWLPETLASLMDSPNKPSQIILVDNSSKDSSREIAESMGCEVLHYDGIFNYSRALNIGLDKIQLPLALILSAHCPLVEGREITPMLREFDDDVVAGVFGRQIPTKGSTPLDMRDLLSMFGRERLVYSKFPMFHNAFSLIRMDCWRVTKFDENVNGIEDRIWAKAMCDIGRRIVYQPASVVYHYHGLNQSGDPKRALRVCEQLRKLYADDPLVERFY